MKRSETIAEITKSLSALQGEVHDGIRDTKGGHGKYADLPQLLQIIRPLLASHKLSFTQHPSVEGANILLTSLLTHISGEWMESTLVLAVPPPRGNNASQAVGSGITYARRYALSAIFGVSQEEDDGNYTEKAAPNKPPPEQEHAASTRKDATRKEATVIVGASQVLDVINSLVKCYEVNDWANAGNILGDLSPERKRAVWGELSGPLRAWIKSNSKGKS